MNALGADATMDFRILGPVEVHDPRTGARIVPPGPKQRTLLAALVVRAGQVLSADRLIDELWVDLPPAGAADALQAHAARLRRLLSGDDGPEWISTRPQGYLLRPPRVTTDAHRFHVLSSWGRAVAAADPVRAAARRRGLRDGPRAGFRRGGTARSRRRDRPAAGAHGGPRPGAGEPRTPFRPAHRRGAAGANAPHCAGTRSPADLMRNSDENQAEFESCNSAVTIDTNPSSSMVATAVSREGSRPVSWQAMLTR